jgi:hypothetical protein
VIGMLSRSDLIDAHARRLAEHKREPAYRFIRR